MTTLAHSTTLGGENRQPREPRALNGIFGRSADFAAYEFSGESSIDGGVHTEEAYHRFLERRVAILRLMPAGAGRAQHFYSFVQSIHAQAMLRHPTIAQVLDAGIHDDLPYAVIEQPRGTMLDAHLSWLAGQGTRMDTSDALHIVGALADMVQYAHERGVRVHALTPDRIVITDDGTPVLTRVGAPETPEALHASEARLAFSAPELRAGALSDHRSDIYALGALLYATLTGRTLAGDSRAPLAGLPHGAEGAALETVIRTATARSAAERYASAAEFRNDLAQVLAGDAALGMAQQAGTELIEREVGGALQWPQPTRRPPPAPAVPQPDVPRGMPVQSPLDVPGAGREEVHAVLAYTILVPADADPAPMAAGAIAHTPSRAIARLPWISIMLVVAMALATALMLG